MKDIFQSLRALIRFKTYTIINVAGLALSLACVFILVRYVHQELNVNHFIPELERIYMTVSVNEKQEMSFTDSRDRNNDPNYRNPLNDAAVETFSRFIMLEDDYVMAEQNRYAVRTLVADSAFFSIVPYPLAEGVTDIAFGQVLITRDAARRIFGGQNAIGRQLSLSFGETVTIVGVLDQPSTKSSFDFDFVLSMDQQEYWSYVSYELVRLHKGCKVEPLNNKISQPMKLICYQNQPVFYQLVPLKDVYLDLPHVSPGSSFLLRGDAATVRYLTAAAILILLVGLFNYINLYVVMMLKRGRELALKKILGAGNGRLFMQLYVENVGLCAAALFFAWFILEITRWPVAEWFGIPVMSDLRFDLTLSGVVLFVFPLLLVAYPYFRYVLSAPMRSVRFVTNGKQTSATHALFLFAQYTATFCFVVVAICLSRQFVFLLRTPTGYPTDHILHCQLFPLYTSLDEKSYLKWDEKIKSYSQPVKARIAESPLFNGMAFGEPPYAIQHDLKFTAESGEEVNACFGYVDKQYMEFFGFDIVEGRGWNDEDVFTQYKMIVTQSFVDALHLTDWRHAKVMPEGRLWFASGETMENKPYEIVGLVENFKTGNMGSADKPVVFLFHESKPYEPCFLSITPGREQEAISFLQHLYQEVHGTGDFEYSFLKDDIACLHDADRRITNVIIVSALIAIVISCLGLFGLSLYDIRRRYREIGLRKIHGAEGADIYRLLMRKYCYILVAAFAVGSAIAYVAVSRYLEQFARHVPLSPWIFIAGGVVVAVIAGLTLWLQIRRAVRINPSEVIRQE